MNDTYILNINTSSVSGGGTDAVSIVYALTSLAIVRLAFAARSNGSLQLRDTDRFEIPDRD